ERSRWYLWAAILAIVLPYIAATAGWILTEMGRQPWIVQGLLLTADASSPNVSTAWIVISLTVFVTLYAGLLVADLWLMRRSATLDPPDSAQDGSGMTPMPASGY